MVNEPRLQPHAPPFIARRGLLHAGLLGLGGLSLSSLLRERATAGTAAGKDTSVIFLFLHGGRRKFADPIGRFRPASPAWISAKHCHCTPGWRIVLPSSVPAHMGKAGISRLTDDSCRVILD